MLLFVISAWSVPVRSLTVIDFHGARDHGPKLAPIARCWGGDHVGCLPVCPRSRNRAWAAMLGRVGEGRRGRAVRGKGLENRGGEGQGRPTALMRCHPLCRPTQGPRILFRGVRGVRFSA